MKIAVAGHSRLSHRDSSSQTLGNLCRQFALMDHDPVFRQQEQHPRRAGETSEVQEMEQQPETWRNSDVCSVAGVSLDSLSLDDSLLPGRSSMHSDLLFSRQSTNNFLISHADEKPREGLTKDVQGSRLASIGGLSSCTEFSEEEVRMAEVNPVTFEVFGGTHQLKPPVDSGAPWPSPQEQSFQVGYPVPPYGSQYQASPPRLSDDADIPFDGEFSQPVVYASECHGGGASSPGTSSMDVHHSSYSSEENFCSRARLMCSYGGKIMARPADGKLRYVGGETRIVAVDRDIGYSKFMAKMAKFYDVPLLLKYQLPDEDLDALVSVSSDDDLQNMMEEYDKLESSGGVSRLRLFFFTSSAEYETSQLGLQVESDDYCTDSEQRYIDAINGVVGRNSGGLLEDHDVLSAATIWSGPQVNTVSGAPSAPSSSPSSPPVLPRIIARPKSPGMGDVSFQILNERLHKVSLHPGGFESITPEVDQDSSGGYYSPSHLDHQYRLPVDSPKTHHDISESRNDGWRITEAGGMHRVDSQSMLRQSEQHLDRGTLAEPWHDEPWLDVQQPSEMLLPQRFILQQHKQSPQQPTSATWQSHIDGNVGRFDTMHHLTDVHKQPQTFHQPHQQHLQAAHLRPHQTMAGHDGVSWNSDNQAMPAYRQGSVQSHPHIPVGLGPAPPYQMGSAPASPMVGIHDNQGRCNCLQQHSQVHRGISVSIGDQSHSRRPHFMDQPSRKHGVPNSSRFCDNPNHCGEPLVWQQPPNHFAGPEAEQQEQIGSPWQQFHERNNAQCHLPDCQLRTPTSQFCDPTFAETFLPSHDRHEPHAMRCPCIGCHEHRRQHVENAPLHSVFTDVKDQMGDWLMHQRSLEVDDGRMPAAGRAVSKIPTNKEDNWRGEFEVERRAEGELDSYFTHGQEDMKRAQAMPGGGVHNGRFPLHAVPASRTLVSEDLQASQALLTLAHGDPEWHSKMPAYMASAAVADSWTSPTLEHGGRSDIFPSINSRPSYRIPEEVVNGVPLSNVATMGDGTNFLDQNSVSIGLFGGKRDQACDFTTAESYMQDDFGLPSTAGRVICETAAELLPIPVGVHELLESGYDGKNPSATNKHADLLSCDPISTDSFALSQAAVPASRGWKAFPPGTLSMTALEGSLNTLAFPIYDQSPSSSMNATDFSFEPSEASLTPGGPNYEREACEPGRSAAGPIRGGCEEKKDGNQEFKNRNSHAFQQSEFERDMEKQLGSSNPVLPHSIVPDNDISLKEGDPANDWLKVSIDKEKLAGVVPAVQTDASNELMYEEKHVQIGSVCMKGPVRTQAELDAISHGLQIIKNADLEDLKELGSGTFGTVFHGKWRGSDVAIKRIKASCFTGRPSEQERLTSDFWKEALTLGQLHHPNIVAFYGVVPDGPEGTLATVTEYMVNGSLKHVLHKKDRTIDRRKRLLIAMDAAFGMEYLHGKNIVHFDLKCENLLVNMKDAHRPICKVGDFGLSKVKHQTLVSGGVRGTLPWMAPELLSGNCGMVTDKIDVFSFGIVMWELLTGEEPYANMHCGAIIGGIVNNTLRPPIPGWCDPGWRNLMERCWAGDPADRPSFSGVARELRAIAASMNVK